MKYRAWDKEKEKLLVKLLITQYYDSEKKDEI